MIPEMEYRFVGRSGLQVSAISLGGWITYGGSIDEGKSMFSSLPSTRHSKHVSDHHGVEKTYACLKAAYDAGINFFDCAESYQDGASELAMGRAIKHFGWRRNDLVVSTKINWGAAHSAHVGSPRAKVNNLGLSRKHLIEGTEASLKRLQLSYVDILYAHRPDRHTPIEETVRAFNYLINAGKALYWGTSEWLASEIEEAWAVADRLGLIGPIVEQPGYSLLRREKVEGEFANSGLYARRGLSLSIFSPLAGGLLTGKYVDGIPDDSRLGTSDDHAVQIVLKKHSTPAWDEEQDKIRKLMAIAKKLGTNVATLAMAWVLTNENVCSAITGASKPEQIWETVHAIAVYKKLTPDVLQEIDGIFGNKPERVIKRFG